MFGVTTRDGRRQDRLYSYYRCNGHLSKGAAYCSGMSIDRFQMEKIVEDTLTTFAVDPDLLEEAARTQLQSELQAGRKKSISTGQLKTEVT